MEVGSGWGEFRNGCVEIRGAYDFIDKPISLGELQVTIRNGIEAGRLRREVRQLRREQERRFSFEQIIGESPAMDDSLSFEEGSFTPRG